MNDYSSGGPSGSDSGLPLLSSSKDEDLTIKLLSPDLQTDVPSTKKGLVIPTVRVSPSVIVTTKENGEHMQELGINAALLAPNSYISVDECSSQTLLKNTSTEGTSFTPSSRALYRSSSSDEKQCLSLLKCEVPKLEMPFTNREDAQILTPLSRKNFTNTPTGKSPRPDVPRYNLIKETNDLCEDRKHSKESVRVLFSSTSSDVASTSHGSWQSNQFEKSMSVFKSSKSSRLGLVPETRVSFAENVKPLSPIILRKSWSPKEGEDISPILDQFLGPTTKPSLNQSVVVLETQTAASESCLHSATEHHTKSSGKPSERSSGSFCARSAANSPKEKSRSASLLSPVFRPLLAKQRSKSTDVRNSKALISPDASFEHSDESSVKRSFLSLLSPSRIWSFFKRSTDSIPSQSSCRKSRRKHIDHPEDQKDVVINVSGRRFKIHEYFLSIYPETLLGSKGIGFYYDPDKMEYFFDRDPDAFRHIWNFYYTGELHCPQDECLDAFVDEMHYFGLSEHHMCSYCWSDVFSPIITQLTNERRERDWEKERVEIQKRALGPDKTFRQRLWATFQDPSISLPAKVLYLLSAVVILVSVSANAVETIPCSGELRVCKDENEKAYFLIDSICVGLFTLEYLVKLYACPSRFGFMKNFMSVIDVLAILPYYADLMLKHLAGQAELGIDVFVTLRVLRILRVFKLLRESKRLQKLVQSFKNSASDLAMVTGIYALMLIIFSSLIYFAETSSNPQFGSIPEGIWYAVVTTTTTGYGDIVPKTLLGKIVGSMCCFLGIIVIAFPVPVLQIKR